MRLSETLTGSDGVSLLPLCLTWCSSFGVPPDQLAVTFTERKFHVALLCLRGKTGPREGMLGSEERTLAGGPWFAGCSPRCFSRQACHSLSWLWELGFPCKDTGDPPSPQPRIILNEKVFVEPVSSGLQYRDALMWRAHGPGAVAGAES